jgi:hypothetical protein
MSKQQRLSFEDWYAQLITHMQPKSKGSKKLSIPDRSTTLWDRDIAEQDYNNGLTPGQSAARFRKQEDLDEWMPHNPDTPYKRDEFNQLDRDFNDSYDE